VPEKAWFASSFCQRKAIISTNLTSTELTTTMPDAFQRCAFASGERGGVGRQVGAESAVWSDKATSITLLFDGNSFRCQVSGSDRGCAK
jgi:hypothetical protein